MLHRRIHICLKHEVVDVVDVVELGNPMVASDKSYDQIQNQNCEGDLT